MHAPRLLALGAVLTLFSAAPASAATTFDLRLTDNGNGRWYEYFSDVFAQVDRSASQFYLISALPAFQPVGQPNNPVFTNGANFGTAANPFGMVTYGPGTGVGAETRLITGLVLDADDFIADDDSNLNIGYASVVNDVAGTVSLFNGDVTAINLTAAISFVYDLTSFGGGPLAYNGTFSVSGVPSLTPVGSFVLSVDDSYDVGFGAPLRYRWDFAGSVNGLAPIPEPSTYALTAAGLLALGALTRRRRAV